jgi:hypothetical protein
MSKITLIGILALVVFLVGAGVVFAQSSNQPNGREMMQTPGTLTTSPETPNTPAPDDGNGGYAYRPGMMGNGNWERMHDAMNSGNWERMRDAMNSGNWDEMYKACQEAWNNTRGQRQGTDTTPQTSTPAKTGTTGTTRTT